MLRALTSAGLRAGTKTNRGNIVDCRHEQPTRRLLSPSLLHYQLGCDPVRLTILLGFVVFFFLPCEICLQRRHTRCKLIGKPSPVVPPTTTANKKEWLLQPSVISTNEPLPPLLFEFSDIDLHCRSLIFPLFCHDLPQKGHGDPST